MAPPRPGSGRTAILILSAPGAGAATLARVLEAAGASPPADPAAVAAVTDRALAALGSRRDDPFGPRLRDEPPGASAALLGQARDALRTPEPHAPLLALADPAMTRVAGVWAEALEALGWRTAFVLLVRAPGEAASALTLEAGTTRNRGLLLWASSMLAAERVSRGGRRVAVAWDSLVADPEAQLDRLERALGLRLPRRSWDSAAEIEALLREAPRPPPASPLPQALAPLEAFSAHLLAAAADEPGNADVPAETGRWFASLGDLAAPPAREAAARAPDPGPSAVAERAQAAEAEAAARTEAAEAQVAILQGALAVARRRAAEAEVLLQARATEASAGEREARRALAAAVASREAAQAELDEARRLLDEREAARDADMAEREAEDAEREARLAEAVARSDALEAGLRSSEAARGALDREIDDERRRHGEAREQLALTGIARHAAQARVRELEARIREDEERRRRWLPRLLGLR